MIDASRYDEVMRLLGSSYVRERQQAALKEMQERAQEIAARRELAHLIINVGFKILAARFHPDSGGSHGDMTRLNLGARVASVRHSGAGKTET